METVFYAKLKEYTGCRFAGNKKEFTALFIPGFVIPEHPIVFEKTYSATFYIHMRGTIGDFILFFRHDDFERRSWVRNTYPPEYHISIPPIGILYIYNHPRSLWSLSTYLYGVKNQSDR